MQAPLALALVLVLAGCVSGQPEDVDAASVPSAVAPPTPAWTSIAVDFAGSFGPGVWACPMVTCVGQSANSKLGQDLDHDGAIAAINLTMTWDAATPTMESLRLGVMWGPQDDPKYEMVEGPSPLVLQKEVLDIAADEDVYLWAWVSSAAPMGALFIHTPQDFLIQGDARETLN